MASTDADYLRAVELLEREDALKTELERVDEELLRLRQRATPGSGYDRAINDHFLATLARMQSNMRRWSAELEEARR